MALPVFLKLMLLLPAVPAFANVVGNDTQNFNPITSGIDFVTVQSTETLAPGVINLGLFTNAAKNVLPPVKNMAGMVVRSNDWITGQDFDLGYGLSENTDAGLNVSYLLSQQTDRDIPDAQFSGMGLNEMRANLKHRFLQRRPVGLALIASVNLNQVIDNPFLGVDPGPTWNIELAADFEWGRNIFAFNIGYRSRKTGEPIVASIYTPLTDQTIASLAFSHYFPQWDLKLISEVFAAHQKDHLPPETSNTSVEFLAGGKYDYSHRASIQAGLTQELSKGLFAPDLRVYAGLNYSFEAIQRNAPPSSTAASITHLTVYRGYQPAEIKHLEQTPFDEISRQHEFQLTQTLSEEPEKEMKPPFEIVRLNGLDFPFGSSEIQNKHSALLSRLVRTLNSEPPVIKLRIEGHTDSIGSEERNRSRSQSRAEAVHAWLRAHGLKDKMPVDAVGYGSSRPVADNGNFQGRQQNRRVEVRVLRNIVPGPAERYIEK